MVERKAAKKRFAADDFAVNGVAYAVVTLIALTMLYPVLNVVAVSMSSYTSYLQSPWTVSYTHLDVYKRQRQPHPRTEFLYLRHNGSFPRPYSNCNGCL